MMSSQEPDRERYLLSSVWHDDNKGDSAIAQSVLELLSMAFPHSDGVLASMLDRGHHTQATALRHLRKRFPNHSFVTSPIVKPEFSRGIVIELTKWLVTAVGSATALALRLPTDLAKAIKSSSLVIANGGHTLYSNAGLASLIRLVRILYPYWLAKRYSRPYLIFGQSLGPFEPGIGRWLVKGVLANAESVMVREEMSKQVARELGVEEARLRVVPDAAFLLRPERTEAVAQAKKRAGLDSGAYAVVTVRQTYGRQFRAERTHRYLAEVGKLITGLLDSGLVTRVAVVAHCMGPVPSEDDRLPSRELLGLVNRGDAVLVEDDLAPSELAALYADATWVVGTRFHSVILALIAGTPTIAVSYFGPKTLGIMKMLGLESLCFELSDFTGEEALATILSNDPELLKGKIGESVAALREELIGSVPYFIEAAG